MVRCAYMSDEKIETYDAVRRVGIASGKPPLDRPAGPRRRAPMYYAGETYGRHKVQYPDVERRPNGTLPSIRNKPARRLIRGALKRRFSRVERGLKLPRAMLTQAREVVGADHYEKSSSAQMRRARRLFAQELAIHQTVPNAPTRAQARAAKRAGAKDAISALVDKMSSGVKL